MLKEFKAFISRGNVIDMAVGMIIGSAFGKIVSALVNNIITPIISLATGGINFTEAKAVLRAEVLDAEGAVVTPALTLDYGMFIQTVIDFLIIAFCIFMMVKVVSSIRKKAESLKKKEEEQKPAEPPKPSKEEVLLTEIRDLLKEKN